MKQEAKQEYALQLREYQRRKHAGQQDHRDDTPLVLNLDKKGNPTANKKEEFLSGNDIVVVSKKIRKSTAQKVSQNIGET